MRTLFKIKKQACCVLSNPLQAQLIKLPGVFGVNADLFSGVITIDYTDEANEEDFIDTIIKEGYEIVENPFDKKANEWDTPQRVKFANEFVQEVEKMIQPNEQTTIMDFGCGTGLVGIGLLNSVGRVVMLDSSKAMLEVLDSKLNYEQFEKTQIIFGEINNYEKKDIDILVTLTTLHHIENISSLFIQMGRVIKKGGELIIGELCPEDGSFHHPEIVPHNGFDSQMLAKQLEEHNFKVIENRIYSEQIKNNKSYKRFIIKAINNN